MITKNIVQRSGVISRTVLILVNYKSSKDTANCLRSLHSSTVVPHIVIVDNTPNDPVIPIILLDYPNVHLILAPENLGFGGGNNMGINWAMCNTDCEFIFIFNNDAVVEPDTIVKLEKTLDEHQEAGMSTPRIMFMDRPELLWYGGGEVSWLRGSAVTPGYLGSCDTSLALQARDVTFASGCAMLIRREVMQQLVGFDARFFMYEEDVEMCLRISKLGLKIRYEPIAIVFHAVQASSRGEQQFIDRFSSLNNNLSFYVFHSVRNRLINMHLHARGPNRLIFAIGFSIFSLRKMSSFLFHKRWDGIVSLFAGWRSYRDCFKT